MLQTWGSLHIVSLAASQNARSYGQTFNHRALRICKKRTQKVLMFATLILSNICFSFISVTYTCKPIYKSELTKSLIPLFHQFFRRHLIIFLNKSKYHLFHLLRNIQNIINTNRFWFFNHLFDHT